MSKLTKYIDALIDQERAARKARTELKNPELVKQQSKDSRRTIVSVMDLLKLPTDILAAESLNEAKVDAAKKFYAAQTQTGE